MHMQSTLHILSLLLCFFILSHPLQIGILTDYHIALQYSENTTFEWECIREWNNPPTPPPSTPPYTPSRAPFGRYFCHPPLLLLQSALQKLRSREEKIDAILVPGDLVIDRNINIYEGQTFDPTKYSLLKNTISATVEAIKEVFPDVPVAFALGNHDNIWADQVPTAQYKPQYYDFLYKTFIQEYPPNAAVAGPRTTQNFKAGGYYALYLEGLHILVLNTNYWSKWNHIANDPTIPDLQMAWLEAELENIALSNTSTNALIVGHIPPGTLQDEWDGRFGGKISYYHPEYEEKYNKIMLKYREIVSITMMGHMHINTYYAGELDKDKKSYYNMVVNRAVSPRCGNNPGFQITHMEESPLGLWRGLRAIGMEEYSFNLIASYNYSGEDPLAQPLWSKLYTTQQLALNSLKSADIVDFWGRVHGNRRFANRYTMNRRGFPYTDFFLGVDTITGYITIKNAPHAPNALEYAKNRELFYWLFRGEGNRPLIIWLEGGPGCGPEQNIFLGANGPFTLNIEREELELNPYSWTNVGDTLFIDQPLGTSYSFATEQYLPTTESEIAETLYVFLEGFVEEFPQYKGAPIYITGQSYAGHYIPVAVPHIISKNNPDIKIAGVGIGNPLTDSAIQYSYMPKYAYKYNLISWGKYLTSSIAAEMASLAGKLGLLPGQKILEDLACTIILGVKNTFEIVNYKKPIGYYNKLEEYLTKFLSNLEFKSVIGAELWGEPKWSRCNAEINHIALRYDWVLDYKSYITEMLDLSLPVTIYEGQLDFLCNYMGVEALLNDLQWKYIGEFQTAQWEEVYVQGKLTGHAKRVRNLTYFRVLTSGHLVLLDDPQFSSYLINYLLFA